MRLLERQNEGDFRLTANVLDRDLPRYAILSHTWGDDSEEVSYEDLVEGSGQNKVGYRSSAQNKLQGTACDTSGWTVVAHSNVGSGEITYKTWVHMPPKMGPFH